MKKTDQDKPLYETPKVSKLDDSDTLHGQGAECVDGSSAIASCRNGNVAGGGAQPAPGFCEAGNVPTAFT